MDCAGKVNWYNSPPRATQVSTFRTGWRAVSLGQRGEIGRHDGFKIRCLHGRGGSSPPAGTTYKVGKLPDFACTQMYLPKSLCELRHTQYSIVFTKLLS